MRVRITVCCSAALVLAACGSAPKIATPDGLQRQPVNTPAAIAAHQARIADEEATYGARSEFARKLEALQREVAELKSLIETLPPSAQAAIRASRVAAQGREPRRPHTRPVVTSARPPMPIRGESIEIRPQSIIFRFTHAVAAKDFDPSPAFRDTLLQAAKQARYAEVRGRTDGETASQANYITATARARAARAYLIANGVNAAKIRSSALSAGGYLADNSTATGRALNRRVEIEVMDLDTTAYTSVLSPTPGVSP